MIGVLQQELVTKSIRVSKRCRTWIEKMGSGDNRTYDTMALALVHLVLDSHEAVDLTADLEFSSKEIRLSAVPADWLRYMILRAILAMDVGHFDELDASTVLNAIQLIADKSDSLND